MEDYDIESFVESFSRLSTDEQIKLFRILQTKACFGIALKEDSIPAYSEVIQLVEKALQFYPRSPEMHYIAGIAHFRAFDDRDYAMRKYNLLRTLGPEGIKFAMRLKEDIN